MNKQGLGKINSKMIIGILVVITIIVVNLYLFRANVKHGMEFDEVYRKNNLFPLLKKDVSPYDQSIISLKIGKIKIPMMYKEYLSSISMLPYAPVVFFSDTLTALRCSYCIYTIIVEIALFLFLKEKNRFIAVFSSLLLVVCPLIFPYIRYGWANLIYGIICLLGFLFAEKYNKTNKKIYLFLTAFFFSFLVNYKFYTLWIIAGILFAVIVLFPKKTIHFLKSWKNILVSLCGVVLGLFNTLYYNVMRGFPALKTLYNYLFNLNKYNEKPIDSKVTKSLWSSFGGKIKSYIDCIGSFKNVYLLLLLCLVLIYIVSFFIMLKRKELQQKKVYFAPLIVTVVSFICMLISPNASGSHHLTYIVIFLCITIAVGLWLIVSEFRIKMQYVAAIGALVLVFNFVQCSKSVASNIRSNGHDYFTERIFDLKEYIDRDPSITDKNTLFIEWGFSSQFYFLNNGRYHIWDITFSIRDKTDEKIRKTLQKIFKDIEEKELYIPVYYHDKKNIDYSDYKFEDLDISAFNAPVQSFIDFVKMYDGNIQIQEWFRDDDGGDIIMLKIDNVEQIVENIENSYKQFSDEEMLGPHISLMEKDSDYPYTRGFYAYESSNGVRWVQMNSALLLQYKGEPEFEVSFRLPAFENRNNAESDFIVEIDKEVVYSERMTQGDAHTIIIPLEDYHLAEGVKTVAVKYNSSIITTDSRELSWCLERIGFVQGA